MSAVTPSARARARSSIRALAAIACLLLAGCGRDVSDGAAKASPPRDSAVTANGETTYNRYCFSCHAAGVAGAPRVGDAAAWAPRIAKGVDALVVSASNGVPPGMPAKGLCLQCSEADLRAAIDYMTDRSR